MAVTVWKGIDSGHLMEGSWLACGRVVVVVVVVGGSGCLMEG